MLEKEDADKAEQDIAAQKAFAADHMAFIKRITDDKFHDLKPRKSILALSIIPTGEPAKIDLHKQFEQIKPMLLPLSAYGAVTGWYPSVGSIFTKSKTVGQNHTVTDEIESSTEVTTTGRIFAASFVAFRPYDQQFLSLYSNYEGKMLHTAGTFIQLLRLIFGFPPSFMVGVALLNTKHLRFAADSNNSNPQPITEDNIVPAIQKVDISAAAGDYSNTVKEFARLIRPTLDIIWQHAGYFVAPSYNQNGDRTSY